MPGKAMAEPKTRPTKLSAQAFVDAIADVARRDQCRTLLQMMREATGAEAVMWGSNIVGFGAYRQTYANGREADWPLIGFSPRKSDLTLYLMDGVAGHQDRLQKLGKFRTGKSCLYVRTLDDIDLVLLKGLIAASVRNMQQRHR
jgi:hypothetical protein